MKKTEFPLNIGLSEEEKKDLEKMIAKNEGVSRIELLGNDARWKNELSTHGRQVCRYTLHPKSISSFLHVVAYKHFLPVIKRHLASHYAASRILGRWLPLGEKTEATSRNSSPPKKPPVQKSAS